MRSGNAARPVQPVVPPPPLLLPPSPPSPPLPSPSPPPSGNEELSALATIFPEESRASRQAIHDSYVGRQRRGESRDEYLLRKRPRSRSQEKTNPTKKPAPAIEQVSPLSSKKMLVIEQDPSVPPKKRKAARRKKDPKELTIHKSEPDDEEAPKKSKSHNRKAMDEK
jgi:hypothetical protein